MHFVPRVTQTGDLATPCVTPSLTAIRDTTERVRIILDFHQISTADWGTGNSKCFDNLVEEVATGETSLLVVGDILHRVCSVIRADVRYCADASCEFKLAEARQVFTSGRTRERPTPFAIWEKLLPGETPDVTLVRAFGQELSIWSELRFERGAISVKTEPPLDFPGLPSQLTMYDYLVHLSPQQFNPDGYVERQPDKVTYFEWRSISPST